MFKTKSNASPAEIIRKKLDKRHEILPFPGVVTKLLSSLKDPNSNASSFSKIIEADAGLTVRLLRMANSPIYGNTNTIQSVVRAITVLGISQIRRIALSFAAKSLIFGAGEARQRRKSLWNHSLGCATVARELAKTTGSIDADEAFLAAIFHDVGKLFFYDTIAEHYNDLADSCCGAELIQRESELLGITHEEVGIKLITSWKLPEQLMVAVGFHHRPHQAIAHGELAQMTHAADALARRAGIGSLPDSRLQILPEIEQSMGLDPETIETVLTQSSELFRTTNDSD